MLTLRLIYLVFNIIGPLFIICQKGDALLSPQRTLVSRYKLTRRADSSLLEADCGSSISSGKLDQQTFARPIFCDKTESPMAAPVAPDAWFAHLGEFPSFALLTFASTTDFSKVKTCGGTLIDKDRILTAAYCIDKDYDSVQVQTGIVDLNGDRTNQQVRYGFVVCILDGYGVEEGRTARKRRPFNDLAIIQVDKPFRFDNFTKPACLQLDRQVQPDTLCISIGFGNLNNTEIRNPEAIATAVKRKCEDIPATKEIDDRSRSCWTTSNTKQRAYPCEGDRGSPILCIDNCKGATHRQYLVGAFSFGLEQKCTVNKTKNSNFFSDTSKLGRPLRALVQNCYEYH